MKRTCKSALRSYMTRRLTDARKQSHLTQAKFSEKLMMDTRSYADLEHGKSLCYMLIFIIYLFSPRMIALPLKSLYSILQTIPLQHFS